MDGWKTVQETATRDTKLGMHVADLPTGEAPSEARVQFTFRWQPENRWEGTNYTVLVE